MHTETLAAYDAIHLCLGEMVILLESEAQEALRRNDAFEARLLRKHARLMQRQREQLERASRNARVNPQIF